MKAKFYIIEITALKLNKYKLTVTFFTQGYMETIIFRLLNKALKQFAFSNFLVRY